MDQYWTYAFAEQSCKDELESFKKTFRKDNLDNLKIEIVHDFFSKLKSYHDSLRCGAVQELQLLAISALQSLAEQMLADSGSLAMTAVRLMEETCLLAKSNVKDAEEAVSKLEPILEALRPKLLAVDQEAKRHDLGNLVQMLSAVTSNSEMLDMHPKLKKVALEGILIPETPEHDCAPRLGGPL